MELRDLNPCLRFVQKRSVTVSYKENVYAYDFRLFYLLSGRLDIKVEDKMYMLSPDQVLFIPPAIPYRVYASEENEFIILNFDMTQKYAATSSITPDYAKYFDARHVINPETVSELSVTTLFETPDSAREEINALHNCWLEEILYYKEESDTRLKLLLLSLLAAKQSSSPSHPHIVNRILRYIGDHYREPLTAERLAREFLYHPNHLGRVFREATGVSLHRYVIDCRLREAKELLSTTDKSIETIAQQTGFESPSYFSKYFRQKTGVSPFAYRESHKKWLF